MTKRNIGCFNVWKLISVIHHINKLKKQKHTIITIDVGKAFDKVQHAFMIKILIKVGIEVYFLKHIKHIYKKKHAANIILNVKLLNY